MTKLPNLPNNLDHLLNGRRVWFYGPGSTQPCRGTVVGRGTDPATKLMTVSIVPADPSLVRTELGPSGIVKRTVNAVFPSLDHLNSHAEFLNDATPSEIAEWTRVIIELSAMLPGIATDSKY